MANPADLAPEDFRQAARRWINETLPSSLRGVASPGGGEGRALPTPDQRLWRRAVGERGWGTPTWPAAYGGGGLGADEARVLKEEFSRAGAYNPIGGMGVMMLGPTLLEYGSEAQKARHLPAICRGEVVWCQGFSEPGAGSDLASLQTRADDRGDHFRVNGSKIWTSGADRADWCFALVRTDSAKKHEGISFVLFDMTDPGVEVRPIQLISGVSPFCETFLTDVKVPKENLVGPLNGGWSIAKRLLQHERSGLSGGTGPFGVDVSLEAMAARYVGLDDQGRIADPDLRVRIAAHRMEARAFEQTAARAALESRSGNGPGSAVSIMKNAASCLLQARDELTLEVLGLQALGWQGAGFTAEELAVVRGWLGTKAASIYGGSQEIQNNIIAKRVLGLPDPASLH